MKYLKLFELFEEKIGNFQIIKDSIHLKMYKFNVDDVDYLSIFDGKNDIWFFEYKLYNGSYREVNKNPYRILSSISSIVKDFIIKNEPNVIIMKPKLAYDEVFIEGELNKRAKIFLQLYKHFTSLRYCILQNSELRQTVLLLYKNDFNINELIKSNFKSFSIIKN